MTQSSDPHKSRRLSIDPTISIGNIGSAATTLLLIGLMYGRQEQMNFRFQGQLDANHEATVSNQKEIREVQFQTRDLAKDITYIRETVQEIREQQKIITEKVATLAAQPQ